MMRWVGMGTSWRSYDAASVRAGCGPARGGRSKSACCLPLDGGARAIGTTIDLAVPAAFLVLVGNLCGLTRCGLLARSELGRPASRFLSGERLGVRAIGLVGPTAVVFQYFISNLAHIWSFPIGLRGERNGSMHRPHL